MIQVRTLWRASFIVSVIWTAKSALPLSTAFGQLADPIPGSILQSSIQIGLTQVANAISSPVWASSPSDGSGRIFVVDQTGKIVIVQNNAVIPDPFLDMSTDGAGPIQIVNLMPDFDERGLLGLAFHPDFSTTGTNGFGKLYTYSSEAVGRTADFPLPVPSPIDHQSVVREWQIDAANPNRVDPTSVREILRVDEPQFNHNAGALVFGPDGFLYIALGDGGMADDQGPGHVPGGNGQDTSTILGKIARVDINGDAFPAEADRNYAIPPTNPFVGQEGLDEIFASGFRNPFRMSFDRGTGQLIVADVGQNDIEEVDVVTVGGNFGWPLKEGSFRFDQNGDSNGFVTDDTSGLPPDLIDPVLQYDHDEGVAVIGGFVYRGSVVPELVGKYIFGELAGPDENGRLFVGDLEAGAFEQLTTLSGLVLKGFGEDEAGELYVLASPMEGPFFGDGVVLQIVPEPSGAVPLMSGGAVLVVWCFRRTPPMLRMRPMRAIAPV
jgi:glucose/arabinose dehydrogenase